MSVRVGDRVEGQLTAIDATRILVSYTYDRVHDKTLPKEDRWLMSKTIWDDASMARAKFLRGNAIRVKSYEEAVTRLILIQEAIGHLDSLNSSIDTLHIKKKISDNQADHWTGLATKAQNLIKKILSANRRDYAEYLKIYGE